MAGKSNDLQTPPASGMYQTISGSDGLADQWTREVEQMEDK